MKNISQAQMELKDYKNSILPAPLILCRHQTELLKKHSVLFQLNSPSSVPVHINTSGLFMATGGQLCETFLTALLHSRSQTCFPTASFIHSKGTFPSAILNASRSYRRQDTSINTNYSYYLLENNHYHYISKIRFHINVFLWCPLYYTTEV